MENIQEIFSIVQQPVYMFCWGGRGARDQDSYNAFGPAAPHAYSWGIQDFRKSNNKG